MALDTVAKLSSSPRFYSAMFGPATGTGGATQYITGNTSGFSTAYTTTATVCGPAQSPFSNYAAIDAAPGDTYLTKVFSDHRINDELSCRHSFVLCDLLVAAGGFSGSVNTLQTFVAAPDVSVGTNNMVVRRGASDYSDVRWFVTIQSEVGSTSTSLNITYTDAAGTPGQVYTLPDVFGGGDTDGRRVRRVIPMTLPGGARSIQSGQLAATTGAAGNWGVMAMRPYGHLQTGGNAPVRTYWPSALIKMPATACPVLLGVQSLNVSHSNWLYTEWVKA